MKLSTDATGFSSQDLDLLQRQLDLWRVQHGRWARFPQGAWSAAVTLAQRFGPSLVSRRLRLSYAKLRRLMTPAPKLAVVPARTSFVEVALNGPVLCSGQPDYRAELDGGAKGKLTLRLGSDLPAVFGLYPVYCTYQCSG